MRFAIAIMKIVGIRNVGFLSLVLVLGLSTMAFAQAKPGDGTALQRLDVMREKLERMRRSLGSAISVLKEENKNDKNAKDAEKKIETPLGRLTSLEKDASRLQSDVNNLRGKVDRGDKYDRVDVDSLEQSTNELQVRVDTAELETASARANPTSNIGQPREKQKKKKFLGIFGGGGNDEYEELLGSVQAGRDRELFVYGTREIRKRNYDVGRLL